MAANRNIGVTLDQVYRAIRDQIVSAGILQVEYVFPADEDAQEEQPAGTDLYCTIVLGAQVPDERTFDGAGRIVPMFTGTVATFLWGRISYDMPYRDQAQITDTIFGLFEKERRLIQALDEFDPVNNNGDFMLAESMRMAAPGFHLSPRRTLPGWHGLGSAWELKYILDLTDQIPPT